MKYIFFGTPRIAMLVLKGLMDNGLLPQAVVTNPDRPAGRKKIITPSPVKKLMQERDPSGAIPIFQPEKIAEIAADILNLAPDLLAITAYTQIIPKSILAIPRFGAIGVHPSLLPKYRGPSPMPSAILAGEAKTGVTLYLMDEKMDNGPILASAELQIEGRDYLELEADLAKIGADLFAKAVPKFLEGNLKPVAQDRSQASFTKKFTTEDGFVAWKDLESAVGGDPETAATVWRKIRAFNPEPGAWTLKGDLRIKLLRADLKDNALILQEIQRAGKTPERFSGKLP